MWPKLLIPVTTVIWGTVCFSCCNNLWAQQKIVFIEREEDVIANTVVQRTTETNKITVAGPLVPLDTQTRPIVYTINTVFDGEAETTTFIINFQASSAANEFRLFETIVNEEGRRIPVSPFIQQEIEGRKNATYIVSLSDDYLQKVSMTGIDWSFHGEKDKAKIKVPGFFFSGYMKRIERIKVGLETNTSDESLVFSGSIGSPKIQNESNRKDFQELNDFLYQTLIFVPLTEIETTGGYGLQITGSEGHQIDQKDLAGKEIQLLTSMEDELGRKFFSAKLADKDGLIIASSYASLNPLRGLVPKSEIEQAKTKFVGKILWLRTNRMLTYDAVTEKLDFHEVKRLQPVSVERVVLGSVANPIRLILRTENGEQYFQEYTNLKGLFREAGAQSFERLFYIEDPQLKFGWPDDVVRLIGDSKIQFGMTQAQVISAWDEPEKKNTVSTRGMRLEQWIYGDQFIYFEDGKYIDYQEFNSR